MMAKRTQVAHAGDKTRRKDQKFSRFKRCSALKALGMFSRIRTADYCVLVVLENK